MSPTRPDLRVNKSLADMIVHHTGEPVSHGFAKEMLAGFAGAEVDKLFETKGLDYMDREKAKREAEHRAKQLYDQQYGDQDQWTP